MWILLALLSALMLGLYDLAKKSAVHNNAVPAVLLLNVLTAAALYSPVVIASYLIPESVPTPRLRVDGLDRLAHLQLLAKSVLVGMSWTCAFFALKHLPISVAAPIRSTSPLWTVLIAVGFLAERPGELQWVGMALILIGFLFFSNVGKREGIHFRKDRWVALMILATLLGSLSALYDKYLLQVCGYEPVAVQAWFSIYLCPVMMPLAVFWYLRDRKNKPFQFRWSIPAIALSLLIADLLYFSALSHPDALISIVSPVRRVSVVIPFLFGIVVLGEQNWRPKLLCILAMLVGVLWIGLGK